MTLVALSHGYPPLWNMGGEVSLHRTLQALSGPRAVLTVTDQPYSIDGIRVRHLDTPDVFDLRADPAPIARQLKEFGARAVIAQNELSLPAVRAARLLGIPSIVSVHTPPKYGSSTREAIPLADCVIYNTSASAREWGEPGAFVLHPPTGALPARSTTLPRGDAYTILSSLGHKGVEAVLELARRMPAQRFIVVESPAKAMEPTSLYAQIAALPNVELHPRVAPDEVARVYLAQTRILLVPSRFETYGMSAIEAAGYGIPSVHVDTSHAREGIGEAAVLVPGLNPEALERAVLQIEADYSWRSALSRARAEWLAARQALELNAWAQYVQGVTVLTAPEQASRARHFAARLPRDSGVLLQRSRPVPSPAAPSAQAAGALAAREKINARRALFGVGPLVS